jgi:hypothetical protein
VNVGDEVGNVVTNSGFGYVSKVDKKEKELGLENVNLGKEHYARGSQVIIFPGFLFLF